MCGVGWGGDGGVNWLISRFVFFNLHNSNVLFGSGSLIKLDIYSILELPRFRSVDFVTCG